MEPAGPSTPVPPRRHRLSSRRRTLSASKSAHKSSLPLPNANRHSSAPEVIASLISSLAAKSTDAEHHFDQLPRLESNNSSRASLNSASRTLPTSQSAVYGLDALDVFPKPPLRQGFGVDYGAYRQPAGADQQSYLLEDTAYPPVVRMSRPRVASSHSPSSSLPPNSSQHSLRTRDETASMRRLSAEPALQPPSPSWSSPRNSILSRFLGRRSSKESLPTGQGEPSRSNDPSNRTLSPLPLNLKHTHSRSTLREEIIDETAVGWQSPPASPSTPARKRASSNMPGSSSKSPTSDRPASVGSGRVIPSRRSSLKHTTAGSPAKDPTRRAKHKRTVKDPTKCQAIMDEEEDSTVRRIRELQKQKEKREREQRREERRREKKSRPLISEPAPPLRIAADHVPQHSTSEPQRNAADTSNLPSDLDAKKAALTINGGRSKSAGQLPSAAGIPSQPTAGSISKTRPLLEGGRSAPALRHRHLSDALLAGSRPSSGADRPQSPNSTYDAVDAYLHSPRLTQRLRHPETGRVIAFSELGDPCGFPVVCCMGMGMTRYIMAFYDELATTLRLRLITIDRPGVGESDACSDGTGTPLNWPDDVSMVCSALSISKFSLIAHSAGAIYALATALRLPQQVRGRVHLMGAWIPPSQISWISSQDDSAPSSAVPYSQKLLRVLPESLLKAANSSFISSTTSSMSYRSTRRSRRKSADLGNPAVEVPPASSGGLSSDKNSTTQPTIPTTSSARDRTVSPPSSHEIPKPSQDISPSRPPAGLLDTDSNTATTQARQHAYESRLTQHIWDLAQRRANPAVDLLVCIERRQTIGFRYVDITRACVFHHGSRDSRVSADNVKRLARKMKRSEVRILDGEGHSLMGNAKVMAGVLTEVAREWEDWARVTTTTTTATTATKGVGLGGRRRRRRVASWQLSDD